MASCLPVCERKTFSKEELNNFALRTRNILENSDCRLILKNYLLSTKKRHFLKVLTLYEETSDSRSLWDDIMDLIDEIDNFNTNPLLSISENSLKFAYVQQQCEQMLENVRPVFVRYLEEHYT